MENTEFTKKMQLGNKTYNVFDVNLLESKGIADIRRLPFTIKILVENLLRKLDGRIVTEEDLLNIARWQPRYATPVEIPYHPARVLMQDFTGVPAVVDLAAMRDAVKDMGQDPECINPLVPVELIVDHSIQVDYFGSEHALELNVGKEYERNRERYTLLKWAQKNFHNFQVVPPNSGICHQVNLEYLGRVVITEKKGGINVAFPDTLVGTDSHTTMINSIGVMGWGVGGIEAEAVMLGQPYYMAIPEVIGVRLSGRLNETVTGTDLVLRITELLREHQVVEKFVEYFGPGLKNISVTDRATIANMSPEYGATMGFFPVDEKTIDYLKMTGRQDKAEIVDYYTRELGLYYTGQNDPLFTKIIELDLSTVEPAISGPARPQDRIALSDLKNQIENILGCQYETESDVTHLRTFQDESGHPMPEEATCRPALLNAQTVNLYGYQVEIGDGSIVIAAITSCTNTSNPFVMMGAGMLAKNAVKKGLKVPAYVKTSLAPGSRVVVDYLENAGLMPYLEALGFHLAGFGCTTCIGNSGPLHPEIEKAIFENDLSVAAILSGNRNFEARIHPSVKANFLASPMLVVAFAIAGRMDIDLTTEPLTFDPNGVPVYLTDIWPSSSEINMQIKKHVNSQLFKHQYGKIYDGDDFWKHLPIEENTTYPWDENSTYIKLPPYFEGFSPDPVQPEGIDNARLLILLGDSVTTDHISPAGRIPADYPAGSYLMERGVEPEEFNSYGSRRGNHEVMVRGTFGNIRIKNQLISPKEGSYTLKFPEADEMYVYEAATAYMDQHTPLITIGGKEYGTGSSRDWAAKGVMLLGVKAVIAESFERIHRSNLVGMGILPLIFQEGENWKTLGLVGDETYYINGVRDMTPRKVLSVCAVKTDGSRIEFNVISRLDTEIDIAYYQNGGILPYVLRNIVAKTKK